MTNQLTPITRRSLLAIAALSAFAGAARAEDPKIRSIIKYTIKVDRTDDFEAAVKEYNGLLRKAGYEKSFTWWLSLSGTRSYNLVRYYEKYSDLETSEDPKLKDVRSQLTRLSDRMRACTDSMERIIDEIQTELSLPPTKQMPAMVSVLVVRARPDRVNEFTAAWKTDLLPAVKKSGTDAYVTARARFGASRMEFRSSMGIKNWSELDATAPIVKAMGAEGYQRYLTKIMPMIESVEYNLYRYLPELSYMAQK